MTNNADDHQMWAALVAAEQELARRRAEFYQHAQSRTEILAAALAGSNWDRGTALSFIQHLRDDAPALLNQLVEHALSHRWALAARQAIAPARGTANLPELDKIVTSRLNTADDDEYRRLAELLAHAEAWTTLGTLVRQALASENPDIREVGEDFTEEYGPLLSRAEHAGNVCNFGTALHKFA